MAIQTGRFKKRRAQEEAIKSIADTLSKERAEEGKFQGIMQLVNPLIAMGTKWGGKKLLKAAGITAAPWLAPFIAAYTAYEAKKGIEKLARKKGAGAEVEEIVADSKYGFGEEEAKTYREGLEQTIEGYGPNLGVDIASSYIGALTPKIVPGKDGGWTTEGGELTEAYKGKDFTLKDLLPLRYTGKTTPTAYDLMYNSLNSSSFPQWEKEEVTHQLPSSFLNLFSKKEETERDKFSLKEEIKRKGRDLLPDWMNPDWFDEGGQVPKYYGGGSVQGGSPTISEYFDTQGKTLGGSNQQSLVEMLNRRG
tara:strand:+ start:3308 stop:4228 length:921 start_codon:yes stop_codon:yes gene_type:complete